MDVDSPKATALFAVGLLCLGVLFLYITFSRPSGEAVPYAEYVQNITHTNTTSTTSTYTPPIILGDLAQDGNLSSVANALARAVLSGKDFDVQQALRSSGYRFFEVDHKVQVLPIGEQATFTLPAGTFDRYGSASASNSTHTAFSLIVALVEPPVALPLP